MLATSGGPGPQPTHLPPIKKKGGQKNNQKEIPGIFLLLELPADYSFAVNRQDLSTIPRLPCTPGQVSYLLGGFTVRFFEHAA
jgi:hypothetical protein